MSGMSDVKMYVEALKERVQDLEKTLEKIELMCDWVDNDRAERDKVLCNTNSIRFEIARVHPKCFRGV